MQRRRFLKLGTTLTTLGTTLLTLPASAVARCRPSSMRPDGAESEAVPKPRADRAILFRPDRCKPRFSAESPQGRGCLAFLLRMGSVGWQIGTGPENHIQVVDLPAEADGAPLLMLHLQTGQTLQGRDCLDVDKVAALFHGPQPSRYPIRESHWTVAGNPDPQRDATIAHLLEGSNHRGSFDGVDWSRMSRQQCLSLHDDHHENRVHWFLLPLKAGVEATDTGIKITRGLLRGTSRVLSRSCPT